MTQKLTLPCWVSEDDTVTFKLEDNNTIHVRIESEFNGSSEIVLSSMSRDRLRGWLDGVAT